MDINLTLSPHAVRYLARICKERRDEMAENAPDDYSLALEAEYDIGIKRSMTCLTSTGRPSLRSNGKLLELAKFLLTRRIPVPILRVQRGNEARL